MATNRLKALRDKRGEVLEKAEAITAKADTEKRLVLTTEERAAHDGHLAEIAALDKEIEAEHKMQLAKAANSVPVGETRTDAPRPAFSTARQIFAPLRNIVGEGAQERAHRVGQIWFAMRGVPSAQEWCRQNGVYKAMSEGINSAGGFLVPHEMLNEIIILLNAYGTARQNCRMVPMSRDTVSIPKLLAGPTMYFTGEGVAGTQSQLSLGQVNLTAKKGMVLTGVSSELSEDSAISIADLLVSEMARAIRTGEDGCLFSGDGTSTYGGMTGLRKIFNDGVGSLAGAVDGASGHDTMAEMDAPDLARLMGALPQYVFEGGEPKFYCSQTMWANVFERLIGASGGVTKDQASGRTIREYNGYPVVITPAMLAPATPTTDTSDVAMILFGDLRLATVFGDRREITIESSKDWKFDQDQIFFKATSRFDIVCHGTGDTTTPGPVVALMGE